ncbi:MAG TPA: hypothetical protein VFF88_04610 [Methylocella sp.]|nr:hypothetical protein [Methylocella sp.]
MPDRWRLAPSQIELLLLCRLALGLFENRCVLPGKVQRIGRAEKLLDGDD